MTDFLKQEEDKFVALNEEKNELENSLSKMTFSYKDLLKNNADLEEDLRKSENNIKKIKEKMKFQSGKHKDDIRQVEEKLIFLQKDNCHKSHKISFMLEKIESDCQRWNCIENDLKEKCTNHSLI